MKVQRVFHRDVACIEAWESLQEAASRMHSGGFSCLPVISGDDLVGIITERDVVEAVAGSVQPELATVFDYMTEEPQTVSPDDDCSVAATEMLSVGCRHLPVMEGTKLVGIVSARDLLPLATSGVVEG
jgi:CBS domain-containing protein